MAEHLGVVLRRFRSRAGLTQEALAERSGVSVSTIRGFETGRRQNPQLGTVKQLADALGLPSAEHEELMSSAVGVAPQASPLPRQLPAASRWFTGRSAELATLDQVLSRPGVAVLSGSGGIGKSTLAVQWAHRNADRFPDGQLFVNLRGFDPSGTPVPATTALRGFIDALGVPPDAVPPDLDGQAALFRSLTADQRLLVVLDNAADAAQVVPLLPSGDCAVLITSRHRLSSLVTAQGAVPVLLETLPDSDARALLTERLGSDRVSAEPRAVDELIAHCGGLPLALSIVAGRAQGRRTFSLDTFAGQLGDVATRLGELDDEDPVGSVRAVLSWSTAALDAEQARMFALLGGAPGPDISTHTAACLSGVTPAAGTRLVRALERASLLHEHMPGRYRMYDLVRLHAAEIALPEEERAAALRRLVDLHTHTAYAICHVAFPHRAPSPLDPPGPGDHPFELADHDAAWRWYDAERACLATTIQVAAQRGLDRQVWQLAWYLAPFHSRRHHLQDKIVAWQQALAAAHRIEAHDGMLADTLRSLGHTCNEVGRIDDGLVHLRQALSLSKRSGSPVREGVVENSIAHLVATQGDFAGAMRHAQRSYELLRQQDNEVLTAQALGHIGWVAAKLGEYETAFTACSTAIDVLRKHEDRDSEAILTDTMAMNARLAGRFAEALDLYQRAGELLRATGNTSRTPGTDEELGQVHAALGDDRAARAAWERALREFRAQYRFADAERVEARLRG